MEIIGLTVLSKKYGYGTCHLRTILCRPEFNKYRTNQNFYFNNIDEFHQELKNILRLKNNNRTRPKNKYLLLICLLLNCQITWSCQYEPIIIYTTTGEPQSILKGHIIYDNYGVPKSNTQAERSLFNVRKK